MNSNYKQRTLKEISGYAYQRTCMTRKTHVHCQASKANKPLGYIRRNALSVTSIAPRRTTYIAFVRSNFGYGSQIWAPQSIELIDIFERIQRRATKYILNLPFSTDVDYSARLQSLHLLPLSYWHEYRPNFLLQNHP
jgi:hypothetical protein